MLNGEFRDRERARRSFKRMDTLILEGYRLYYNFVRPLESLDGDMPAGSAGIRVKGSEKWLTLIQDST